MRPVLDELVRLLKLERIEANTFRGQSQDLGWGAIFGGQVIGQALSAAVQTVPTDRHVHSLHAYFLRQGNARKPVLYEVDRIRDGHSFATRRVVAIQDGQAIFSLSASFHLDESGFDHQDLMPSAPPPEALISEVERGRQLADKLPSPLREMVLADRPIEIRLSEVLDPISPPSRPPRRQVWLRAADPLPDDPALHRYLLAYASDFQFLVTALQPHGVSWLNPQLHIASLDHAMWFHRPFRADEWLLYDIESSSASGSRGLVHGRFFDQSGRLVASAAQEGLMRMKGG